MYYLFPCTGLFDGFVARALKANSDLGVQLDSLADMVSFGFLPGLTMYKALEGFGDQAFGISLPFDIKYIGLLVTLSRVYAWLFLTLTKTRNITSKDLILLAILFCCSVCIMHSEKSTHFHFYSKMQDYL